MNAAKPGPVANAAAVAITKPAKLPKDCPFAAARRQGWEDKREGRAPDYRVIDGLPRKEAYAYERGRFQAALAGAAKPATPLPAWPMDQHIRAVLYRFLGAAKAKALLTETATGRSRQNTVKSQRPRPPAVPVSVGRRPLPTQAAVRRSRRRMDAEAEALMLESCQR